RAEEMHAGASDLMRQNGEPQAAPPRPSESQELSMPRLDASALANGRAAVEGLDSRNTFVPPAAGAVARETLDQPLGERWNAAPTQAASGGEEAGKDPSHRDAPAGANQALTP